MHRPDAAPPGPSRAPSGLLRSALPSSLAPLSLALSLAFAPPAAAQDAAAGPLPEEPPLVFPADRPSADARLDRAARTVDDPDDWQPPEDPLAWLERVEQVKVRMRVALGLWPHPSAGLDPLSIEVVQQDGFTLERTLIMGHWFYFLAANVYRPSDPAGPMPIVIVPAGDWGPGRLGLRPEAEAQALVDAGLERELTNARRPRHALCAQLARMGCLVIQIDLTGAGESNLHDPVADFTGVEALQRNQGLLGWRTWDVMMAVSQAYSYEGADLERVAVIGDRGAGFIGTLLAVQDKRFDAIVAIDWLDARRQAADEEWLNPPHLRVGTSDLELTAVLSAPWPAPPAHMLRPDPQPGEPRWLYLAQTGEEAPEVVGSYAERLREAWNLTGEPERLWVDSFPDEPASFGLAVREGIYAFLADAFGIAHEGPIVEAPVAALETIRMMIHDAGARRVHPREQGPREVIDLFSKLSDRQLDQVFEPTPKRVQVFDDMIGPALEVLMATELPAPEEVLATRVSSERRGALELSRLALSRAGSGEEVPAVLLMPDDWNGTVLVGVGGRGKRDFFGDDQGSSLAKAARCVENGVAFLALDPLLTGESLNPDPESGAAPSLPRDAERDARSVAFTLCYNKTLLAERVHDVLTAIGYARGLADVQRVNLVGTGAGGTWALLARALCDDAVDRTAVQWTNELEDVRDPHDPDFLPGAVRYGNLPCFAALISPHPLYIVADPARISPRVIPELTIKAFKGLGADQAVRTFGSRNYEAVQDWVAGF